jgi:hypothetical protein
MSDLRKQIRDHYAAQSLPHESVAAILAKGRAVVREKADIATHPPASAHNRRLLALAASVTILAGVWAFWQFPRARVDYAEVPPAVIAFFANKPMYPKMSERPDELRAWAIEQGAPTALRIPSKLRILPGKGCTILGVNGKSAYLLCFLTVDASGQRDGGMVHLVVARRRDFRDLPPSGKPWIDTNGDWSFASWTEGKLVYTIATPAPVEKLRSYLATLPLDARATHPG